MATVSKTDITNGAELTITTNFPQITIQSLFSFINTNYATYFTQEFKYSVNGGGSYTSYQTLNETNIRAVSTDITSDLVVVYKYVRTATPTSGDEVVIKGTQSELIYPIYDNTFFKDFIDLNDYQVLQWALSVLEKLYSTGELPKYLTRNLGNNIFDDEDFISFWYTICHFFGVMVIYARQFQDIRSNETLLKYFLDNIGIYYNRNNTFTELQYLFDNYIQEFERRGTNQILSVSEVVGVPNGELLRLIDYISTDEFLFALTQVKNIGWNVGTSSPCYGGTEEIVNCTKKYEFGEDVTDLDLYPLENDAYITLNGGYIKIDSVPAATYSGSSSTGDSTAKIYVSPEVDYEISFKIKKDDALANVNFGVTAYDAQGNQVDLLSQVDGTTSNDLFTSKLICNTLTYNAANTYNTGDYVNYSGLVYIALEDGITGAWNASKWNQEPTIEYWVRGIIFNKYESDDADDVLNVGYGHNLRFQNTVRSIIPNIRIEGNAAANTSYIRDIKVRPAKLPVSQGLLGSQGLIFNWLTNNSGIRNTDITEIIKTYLIPYNSTYYPIYLTSSVGTVNYLLLNTGGFVLLNSGGKIIINN